MKRVAALGAALVLVAACSSTSLTDTPASSTTVPSTALPPSSVADTTTTTEACPTSGDTGAKTTDDPLLMSGMVGADIRAGAHPCFERVVIELSGSGDFPGWSVEYVEDPVRLGESDEFVEILGEATLQVTMRMWMPEPGGLGYPGPIQFAPENVFRILELRETENHEGMCIWSIGLDAEYAFTVEVFHDPERLVIDIQISV